MTNDDRDLKPRLVLIERAAETSPEPAQAGDHLWVPGKWGRKPRGYDRWSPGKWRDDAQAGWFLIH